MKIQEIVSKFFPSGMDTLGDIIGPQGNLLEKLDRFNNKYMAPDNQEPLKVTKTWRWGNGTYDRVKTSYTRKVMQWHKRPRGMNTLFNRKRTWFENDMKRELLDIEQYLIQARREGSVWLDKDTDDGLLEQYLYDFCRKFNVLERILKQEAIDYSIDTINARTCWQSQHRPNNYSENDIVPGIIFIAFTMPDYPIKVSRDGRHVIDIPFPPLTIYIKIDVSKWISHSINPLNIRDGYNSQWMNYFNLGIDFDIPKSMLIPDAEGYYNIGEWPIFHPFVQNHGYTCFTESPTWYWKNHCWGNFGNYILQSFMKMDFEAFFIYMRRWLYNYELINANPLNNIRKSFLGVSKEMQETAPDLLDVTGYDYHECNTALNRVFKRKINDNIENVLNYCDNTVECQISNNCMPYLRNHTEKDCAYKALELCGTIEPSELKWENGNDILHIYRNMVSHFCMTNNYHQNIDFLGIHKIWDELCGENTDNFDFYANLIPEEEFHLNIRCQTVITFLLYNKLWDAYIHIMALTYLSLNNRDYEINDTWDTRFKTKESEMKLFLKSILIDIEKRKDVSEEDVEKMSIQQEMLQWSQTIRR